MNVSPIEPMSHVSSIDYLLTLGERATATDILRRTFYDAWLSGAEPALRSTTIDRSIAIRSTLPSHLTLERSVVNDNGVVVVARGTRCTVMVEVQGDNTFVRLTAATEDKADALLSELVTLWGSTTPSESITMQLWHAGFQRQRTLSAPEWCEVSRNYPGESRSRLDQLMQVVRPRTKGKLILWHGPPGTGKTSAIRALARAWAPWCGVQYISDPEKLFGDPDYLVRVLESAPDRRSHATLDTTGTSDHAWQLIVAEDSDDYLRSTKGTPAGGSLGRILNLTDGLLGQSFNALVLLTTNEDVTRLHPALTRPGRCLARVPFKKFTPAAAAEWLHNSSPRPREPMTLAELYLATGELQVIDTSEGGDKYTGMYL